MWIGAGLSLLRPDRRTIMPSIAIAPAGLPVTEVTEATRQRRNDTPSRDAKLPAIGSCEGVPSRNARNRRNRDNYLSPNRAMPVNASAPAR